MKATATLEGCKTIEELAEALEALAYNIRKSKDVSDNLGMLTIQTGHRKHKIIITQSHNVKIIR